MTLNGRHSRAGEGQAFILTDQRIKQNYNRMSIDDSFTLLAVLLLFLRSVITS